MVLEILDVIENGYFMARTPPGAKSGYTPKGHRPERRGSKGSPRFPFFNLIDKYLLFIQNPIGKVKREGQPV